MLSFHKKAVSSGDNEWICPSKPYKKYKWNSFVYLLPFVSNIHNLNDDVTTSIAVEQIVK